MEKNGNDVGNDNHNNHEVNKKDDYSDNNKDNEEKIVENSNDVIDMKDDNSDKDNQPIFTSSKTSSMHFNEPVKDDYEDLSEDDPKKKPQNHESKIDNSVYYDNHIEDESTKIDSHDVTTDNSTNIMGNTIVNNYCIFANVENHVESTLPPDITLSDEAKAWIMSAIYDVKEDIEQKLATKDYDELIDKMIEERDYKIAEERSKSIIDENITTEEIYDTVKEDLDTVSLDELTEEEKAIIAESDIEIESLESINEEELFELYQKYESFKSQSIEIAQGRIEILVKTREELEIKITKMKDEKTISNLETVEKEIQALLHNQNILLEESDDSKDLSKQIDDDDIIR